MKTVLRRTSLVLMVLIAVVGVSVLSARDERPRRRERASRSAMRCAAYLDGLSGVSTSDVVPPQANLALPAGTAASVSSGPRMRYCFQVSLQVRLETHVNEAPMSRCCGSSHGPAPDFPTVSGTIAGTLDVAERTTREGVPVFEYSLSDVRLAADPGCASGVFSDEEVAALGSGPFVAACGEGGSMRSLVPPASVSPDLALRISGLLSEISCVLPADRPLERREASLLGQVVVRYAPSSSGSVRKNVIRVELLRIGETDALPAEFEARVEGDKALAVDDAGRLVRMDGDETWRIVSSDGGFVLHLHQQTSVIRVETSGR